MSRSVRIRTIILSTLCVIAAGCHGNGSGTSMGSSGSVSDPQSTVEANPSFGIVADGIQTTTIKVTVRDADNNPIPGQTVQLAVTGTGNVLTQPGVTTDSMGVASGTLASTTAETKAIFAVVNPGPDQVVLSMTPTVQSVGDASNISASGSSAIASSATNVIADGVQIEAVTVTVRDINNNPVAGQTVLVSATGNNNTVTQPATTTDQNGVAQGTIASITAEVKTITVTVNPGASQIVLSQQPTIPFIGDPSNISTVLSTAIAYPSRIQATGVSLSTITVTVKDVNGNPVPEQTVELEATGTNNTVVQLPMTTDTNGVATGTLTSTTPEEKTVTATLNPQATAIVLPQTPTVQFVADLIAPGDVRLCYGQGISDLVSVQTWDDSAWLWSAVSSTPSTNATIQWTVGKFSPSGNFEHLLAVLSETATGTDLDLLTWDGDTWTSDWSSTAITKANADKRGFDLEYEATSGEALVVYSNNTPNPVYRTRSGDIWSPETNVFATPPGTGDVLWVELVSRTETDEIALVYADAGLRLHAVVWNGSSWDESETEVTLSVTMSTVSESQAFDCVYESVSGDLLVLWGHQFTTEQVQYATKPEGTGLWTVTTLPTANARAKVVRLSAEGGSDRVAAVLTEGNGDDDTVGMIWDGSNWVAIVQVDSGSASNDRDAGIAWVGTSGTAVLVYRDSDSGSDIDWASWRPALGWNLESDISVAGMGNIEAVKMVPFSNQDKVMVILSDTNSNLYVTTYDGFSWVITNFGVPLISNVSSANTQPF